MSVREGCFKEGLKRQGRQHGHTCKAPLEPSKNFSPEETSLKKRTTPCSKRGTGWTGMACFSLVTWCYKSTERTQAVTADITVALTLQGLASHRENPAVQQRMTSAFIDHHSFPFFSSIAFSLPWVFQHLPSSTPYSLLLFPHFAFIYCSLFFCYYPPFPPLILHFRLHSFQ